MKYIFLLILVILFISCGKQNQNTLKQKIKTEKLIEYYVNDNGDLKRMDYNSDIINEYSEKGKLLKKTNFSYFPEINKDSINSVTNYEYNNGLLIKEIEHSNALGETSQEIILYKYENNKLKIKEVVNFYKDIFSNNNNEELEYHYHYNKEQKRYISDGSYIVRKFNSDKMISQEFSYDKDKKLTQKAYYKYKDKKLAEQVIESANNKTINTFEYNSKGNLTKEKVEYIADYMPFSNTTKYSYKYDEHNNWIEQKVDYSDEESIRIIKRLIEYYQ